MAKSDTEGSFHEQQCNKGGWISLDGKLCSPHFGEAVASGAGYIQLQHASSHTLQNLTKCAHKLYWREHNLLVSPFFYSGQTLSCR